MRRFKKTIATIAVCSMALSLVGCGGKKDDGKTATKTDADKTTQSSQIEDDGDWVTTEAEELAADKFITVQGADVIGLDFDDNEIHDFVTYTNGGMFELKAENGELVSAIKSFGGVMHACQIYFDGFTMAKGCVYTVSFDVHCDVERAIEWRVQINGGDYHAYAGDIVDIGPETKTITQEFTMNEDSDPAPRFVVNMGKINDMDGVGEHNVYLDNISLFVTDSSNAEEIKGAPIPNVVKVNQLGYAPDDTKTVIATSGEDTKFKIVKADNPDETVFVGKYPEEKVFDTSVSSLVKKGDFSEFKEPGRYKILSSPSGYSYEFAIGDGLYEDVYKDSVLMLYNQRCGIALDKNISGEYAHDECHMTEATVFGTDEKLEVSGGWHDAGDYGRYVVPGAKTVQDLLLAYEDYGVTADDIGIPESGNGVPDLLDEAKYELDWMLKMQDEATGGVYHKVSCLVFPETVGPTEETDELILAPISYAATADFAAVMAKASVVYKDVDATFAANCLEAAKKAYDFIKANSDMTGYKNPEEIVTGEYPDGKLTDETLFAAAELYIATGDASYKSDAEAVMADQYKMGLGWADVGTYPIYDLAKADGIDDGLKAKAKETLVAEADSVIELCEGNAFGVGIKKFDWGSNMSVANSGALFLMAEKVSGDTKYKAYSLKQRDYIFGVNGVAYSFVTGYGTLSPENPHHRPSQVAGACMKGMLIGGANSGLNDPYASAVLVGLPEALAYVDNAQSFSCNEITIYWNSPLIYLLAGVK